MYPTEDKNSAVCLAQRILAMHCALRTDSFPFGRMELWKSFPGLLGFWLQTLQRERTHITQVDRWTEQVSRLLNSDQRLRQLIGNHFCGDRCTPVDVAYLVDAELAITGPDGYVVVLAAIQPFLESVGATNRFPDMDATHARALRIAHRAVSACSQSPDFSDEGSPFETFVRSALELRWIACSRRQKASLREFLCLDSVAKSGTDNPPQAVCIRSTSRSNRTTEIFVVTITDRVTLRRLLGEELYLAFPTRITDAFDPWMSQHFSFYREILHDMHKTPGSYVGQLTETMRDVLGVVPTSESGFVTQKCWADNPSHTTWGLTRQKVLGSARAAQIEILEDFPQVQIATNFRAAQLIVAAKTAADRQKKKEPKRAAAAVSASAAAAERNNEQSASISRAQTVKAVTSESNADDNIVLQSALDTILDRPLPLEPPQSVNAVKEGCPACSWSNSAGVFATPASFHAIDAVVRFENDFAVAFQLKDRRQLSTKEWSKVFISLTTLASQNTRMSSCTRLDRVLFIVAGRTDDAIPWDSITLDPGTTWTRLSLTDTNGRTDPRTAGAHAVGDD